MGIGVEQYGAGIYPDIGVEVEVIGVQMGRFNISSRKSIAVRIDPCIYMWCKYRGGADNVLVCEKLRKGRQRKRERL